MNRVAHETESFTPTAADWAEFARWAAGQLDPEPTLEDRAWDDGYTAGRAGQVAPDGFWGLLRDTWEAGYEAGYQARGYARQARAAETTNRAIDAAGGIGPYLHREHERRLGLIPAAVATEISRHSGVGHGSGPEVDRQPE